MGLSTSELRAAWAPPCNSEGFVRVDLYGAGAVTVDPRAVEAVHRLDECLEAWGYETREADTGAYNCRQITGGSGYSLHAYGIALDINWQTNPYSPTLITDMPPGMVDDITSLKTNNGVRVWEWGGNWSGNKDAMHYEIDCTPADLAVGLEGSPKPPPPTDIGVPDMFIVIHEIACCALMGNVLLTYPDWDSFAQATANSPAVPVMAHGDLTPRNAREHIYQQLLLQHVAAVS
jgi:hypothetical protein